MQKVRVFLGQTGILAELKISRIRDADDDCDMICKQPVWLEPGILKEILSLKMLEINFVRQYML